MARDRVVRDSVTAELNDRIAQILEETGMADDVAARDALRRLASLGAPEPSRERTAALVEAVRSSVPARKADEGAAAMPSAFARSPYVSDAGDLGRVSRLLQLARSQVELMGFRAIAAGFLLFGVGFLTVSRWAGLLAAAVTLVPLFGSALLAYALRSKLYRVDEIEFSCPVGPADLALARLVIVGILDLAMGLAATLLLAVTGGLPRAVPFASGPASALAAVTVSWLVPALFMSGLTLAVSLRFGPVVAMVIAALVGAPGLMPEDVLAGFGPFALPGSPGWGVSRAAYMLLGAVLLAFGLRTAGSACASRPDGEVG